MRAHASEMEQRERANLAVLGLAPRADLGGGRIHWLVQCAQRRQRTAMDGRECGRSAISGRRQLSANNVANNVATTAPPTQGSKSSISVNFRSPSARCAIASARSTTGSASTGANLVARKVPRRRRLKHLSILDRIIALDGACCRSGGTRLGLRYRLRRLRQVLHWRGVGHREG